MMNKTEQFIKKAREIHGDKYDYSQTEVTKVNDKVTIICPEHGEFYQTPYRHINEQAKCPKCAYNAVGKKNSAGKERFIQKAKEVHGNVYDYSKVEYKNNKTKVEIVCPSHGSFWQTPQAHVKGSGCTECFGKTKWTKDSFLKKARKSHGHKYDYSKVKFVDRMTPVEIVCPIHGSFWQAPRNHIQHGCIECGYDKMKTSLLKDKNHFFKKAKERHGNKFDYSKVNYIDTKTPVEIVCPKHGSFWQKPSEHVYYGCAKCAVENRNLTTDEFIEKARQVHGDKYDYSKTEYVDYRTKVEIVCPIHGSFWQKPMEHMYHGCRHCSYSKRILTTDEFIEKARQVHGDKYDYSRASYTHSKDLIEIICPDHGLFLQRPNDHLNGAGCSDCFTYYTVSNAEKEVNDFVQSLGFETETSNRSLIEPYEIDIFITSLNIGIEYNGLYWHSDEYRDRSYHKKKTDLAEKKGIKLIQIFEDEWIHQRQLIEAKLTHLLGMNQDRVYARQCTIDTPSKSERDVFYNTNHVQGTIGANVDLGLYHQGNLVCCLSFKKMKDNEWDLVRFASSIHVVGGFSKLLKHFKRNYEWEQIITFADRRWSDGNLYLTNGFKHLYNTNPNYFYVIDGQRKSRIGYQKHKLKDKLDHFDLNLSEVDNMKMNGYYRIFDCGHMKFQMTKE